MQTFRDCERTLNVDAATGSTCASPQIFADLLCGPVSSTDTPMVQGASPAMMFGGGHLRVRYNAAVLASDQAPCGHSVKIITAIVKLPLLEDDLTPAYLPNLAIARSQLSVVHSTQGDNDEDILWWHDDQIDLINLCCNGADGPCAGISATPACVCADDGGNIGFTVLGTAAALYGRFAVDREIRVKRRLREREALFLITEFVNGGITTVGEISQWPIRRNLYMRYAVRPSR